MLILLRIVFGAALLYGFRKVSENAQAAPESGDLTNAFYLAICVLLAIANAVVWAPYFGARLSDPLTSTITKSAYVERPNRLLRLARCLDHRGWRRSTLFVCFLEGIHRPDWPTAFVIGLRSAQPGSWFEKVFAREVFRFDNAQNCLLAFRAMNRHGIDPRPHRNPEINMMLLTLDREARPEPERVAVPPAPKAAPLKRDARIRLFEGARAPCAPETPGFSGGDEGEHPRQPAAADPGVGSSNKSDVKGHASESNRAVEPRVTGGEWSFMARIRALLRGS